MMNTNSDPSCEACHVDQARLRTILDRVTDAFFAVDAAWRFTYLNARAVALLQRPAGSLVGREVWTAFPEVVGSVFERQYRRAMAEQTALSFEAHFAPLDLWLEVSAYPSPDGLSVYFQDIGERRKAEAALRRREQEFATLVEHAPDVIQRFDRELRCTYANAAVQRETGLPPAAFLGRTAADPALGLAAPLVAQWQQELGLALSTGRPREFSLEYLGPHGARWFDVRLAPEFDAGGTVESVLSVARDVTAQRRAETTLRESEERLRHFIEHASDSLLLLDRDGRFLFVSPALHRNLGHAPQALLGSCAADLVHPEDWPHVVAAIRRAFEAPGTAQILDLRVRDAEGAWRPCEAVGRTGRPGSAVPELIVNLRDMTAWKAAEAAQRAEAERFRALSASSPVGIFQSDNEGRITYANPRLQAMWGGPEASPPGTPWTERVHPEDLPALLAGWKAALEACRDYEVDYRLLLPDGEMRYVRGQSAPLRDAQGRVIGSVGTVWDVTERRQIELALAESEQSLRLALGAGRMVAWDRELKTGVLHERRGDVVVHGPVRAEAGQSSAEEVPGSYRRSSYAEFMACVHHDDRPGFEAACARALAGQGDFDQEFRIVLPDGGPRWMHAMGRAVFGACGTPERIVGVSRDVTERKRLESELTHRAHHDTLTGLENRARFREHVELALARAGSGDAGLVRPPAVLFVDLDDFKTVNDSLGHEAGDRLLVLVAARLRGAVRGADTVARLGGDEFAVLLEQDCSLGEASLVAERIVHSLSQPFVLDGRQIHIGASVGIAPAQAHDTPDDLLRNADLAMYRAKNGGKRRHEAFTPEMHAAALDRLTLGDDLHRAVEALEFALDYQPIVELGTRRVVGAEALVRWRHPVRGMVSPGVFIPIAEESGLIPPLGRWVLAEACRNAVQWPRSADAPLALTVNVSARQLQEAGFVDEVREALQRSGLRPASLVLEITESTLMHDQALMLRRLGELKALGVQIAVDDFGTGFSSLAYLQRYPIDVLKIDKSFVDRVAEGDKDAALARTIVALARSLGLRSVAEGVEHAAQEAELQSIGCRYGQGYLFARPMRGEALRALLDASLVLPAPAGPA